MLLQSFVNPSVASLVDTEEGSGHTKAMHMHVVKLNPLSYVSRENQSHPSAATSIAKVSWTNVVVHVGCKFPGSPPEKSYPMNPSRIVR